MIAVERDPPNGHDRRTIRGMHQARLLHINVSDGGVPKRQVEAARITRGGVDGDRQRDTTGHGGPHRAVSILGIEAIRRVAAEGHPIAPGTTGENLTTEGFDVSILPEGTRLSIGSDVVLELSMRADPCRTIRHSFRDLRYGRLGMAAHPADSRMYARVVSEERCAGDPIRLEPPAGSAAEDFLIARRLERAERSSTFAMWASAGAGGVEVHVVDEGDIAIGAAPDVPGAIFNSGFGFALLPDLVHLAVEHFARHRVSGWVWADGPPWDDAVADTRAIYVAGPVPARDAEPFDDGIGVRAAAQRDRRLGRGQSWLRQRRWSRRSRRRGARSSRTWHSTRIPTASSRSATGRSSGTGLLHTHHGVAWLRAGAVLPGASRPRIQRRLLATRIDHARRLGCDLVGASADEGSVSEANLERVGLRAVAPRSLPGGGAHRLTHSPPARSACGAKRSGAGTSGSARRLTAASRSIPLAGRRPPDAVLPPQRAGSVAIETRCARSQAPRGIHRTGYARSARSRGLPASRVRISPAASMSIQARSSLIVDGSRSGAIPSSSATWRASSW